MSCQTCRNFRVHEAEERSEIARVARLLIRGGERNHVKYTEQLNAAKALHAHTKADRRLHESDCEDAS